MVQGTSSFDYNATRASVTNGAAAWEKTSAKRSGYEALQRMEKEKAKSAADAKYGAWGSTFKNKEHFASLHHC